MAADKTESHDNSETTVEVPQIAIAQAEAAASANRDEGAGPLHPPALDTPGLSEINDRDHVPSPKPSQPKEENAQTSGVEEQPIEHVPQVAYGPQLGQVDLSQDGFNTRAKVAGKIALRGEYQIEDSPLPRRWSAEHQYKSKVSKIVKFVSTGASQSTESTAR